MQARRDKIKAANAVDTQTSKPLSKRALRGKERLQTLKEKDARARERDHIGNLIAWPSDKALDEATYSAFATEDLQKAFSLFRHALNGPADAASFDAEQRNHAMHNRSNAEKRVRAVMAVLNVATGGVDELLSAGLSLTGDEFLKGEESAKRINGWRETDEGKRVIGILIRLRILDHYNHRPHAILAKSSRAIGMQLEITRHWGRDGRRGKRNWVWNTERWQTFLSAHERRWKSDQEAAKEGFDESDL